MAFIADKEELKPGLVIFRRCDVAHRNWYCRVRVPKSDRYKTVSLKTSDAATARERAFDHDADLRFRIKHEVPIFNRPFSQVAKEYIARQQERADGGEITQDRIKKITSVINGPLQKHVGTTQIHLVTKEKWNGYPKFRREYAAGRLRDLVSDATIRFEMMIFRAVITFAIERRYITESHRFGKLPELTKMRRDEFTLEEYRSLHTKGRAWVKAAKTERNRWYRTVVYNFVLIMCNTGMRPREAKNLRWRDIAHRVDKDGRAIVVLFVTAKKKSRSLVAPASVGDYLDRIRAISKATEPHDAVFSTFEGKPAKWLYQHPLESLLTFAKLRDGPNGTPRSSYCFRHTYATMRLTEGIDVYLLAEQMGTSVIQIQDHYGHVNTIKNADLVLRGIGGWNSTEAEDAEPDKAEDKKAKVKIGDAVKEKLRAIAKAKQPASPKRPSMRSAAGRAKPARRASMRRPNAG